MSERIPIDVDASEANRTIDTLDNRIKESEEKLIDAGKKVEIESQKSFNQVMGMMRSSYQVLSGFSTALGGSMGQIFSAVYTMITSTIATYTSITAAIAASGPWGWVQAGIMTASLISATVSMAGVMTGQTELSTRLTGLNQGLQGISGMISSFSL